MKKFSIPGYFNYFKECKILLGYIKEHPEYFYEDRCIDSSYDFPAGLLWNGGRVKFHTGYTPFQLDDVMQYYFNETSLKLNHTCTNLLIDAALAQDWTCNLFIKQYYRPDDSVIIASELLYDHLRFNYPEMNFIFSTTLNITDIEQINEITENDIFVLNYRKNNDEEYLKQLTHPQHIELICAEPCCFNCTNRIDHYMSISESQLGILETDNLECPYQSEGKTFSEIQKMPHAITNKRIDELNKMGFEYFKISGRTINPIQWFETMTYYLAKPEYMQFVLESLVSNYFN